MSLLLVCKPSRELSVTSQSHKDLGFMQTVKKAFPFIKSVVSQSHLTSLLFNYLTFKTAACHSDLHVVYHRYRAKSLGATLAFAHNSVTEEKGRCSVCCGCVD